MVSLTAVGAWSLVLSACVLASVKREVFEYKGRVYYYHDEKVRWGEAVRICLENDGHLAALSSPEEVEDLKKIMKSVKTPPLHEVGRQEVKDVKTMKSVKTPSLYAGFHDKFLENDFVTVLGSTFRPALNGLPSWKKGHPKGGSARRCGGFAKKTYTTSDCRKPKRFVCAMNSTDDVTPHKPISGYAHIPGHGFYEYNAEPATWADAEQTCRLQGAHLVTLNSQAEADALELRFKPRDVTSFAFHVGAHRLFFDTSDLAAGERECGRGRDVTAVRTGDFVTVEGQFLARTGYTTWINPQGSLERPASGSEDLPVVYYTRDSKVKGLAVGALGSAHDRRAFICEQTVSRDPDAELRCKNT